MANKMKYIISEVQHVNSYRNGEEYAAWDLTQAKRFATRSQCFYGTVLKIEDVDGKLLSYKEEGKWHDGYDVDGEWIVP